MLRCSIWTFVYVACLDKTRAIMNKVQKKAQPLGAALKVPPKEEVLEECAGTWRRRARSQYANFPAAMQAFSAAVQKFTAAPWKTSISSTNQLDRKTGGGARRRLPL